MRPTKSQVRNLVNFATLYQWDLQFLIFPTAISSPPALEELNLRALTSELPKSTNQKLKTMIRGHSTSQPGPRQYSDQITIAFAETVDNMIANFITDWEEVCTSKEEGSHEDKEAVMATIVLIRLNNKDVPIYRYTLYNCFLEDVTEGTLGDGEAAEGYRPELVISYDDFLKESI